MPWARGAFGGFGTYARGRADPDGPGFVVSLSAGLGGCGRVRRLWSILWLGGRCGNYRLQLFGDGQRRAHLIGADQTTENLPLWLLPISGVGILHHNWGHRVNLDGTVLVG